METIGRTFAEELQKFNILNDSLCLRYPHPSDSETLHQLFPWIASVGPVSHSLCSPAQLEASEFQWGRDICYSCHWVFLRFLVVLFRDSLSLREVWLSPPAQDHLCWRISAHVFFVDLLMADSYLSWRNTQSTLSQSMQTGYLTV